jgi:purine-binding chemotaxis protein CheW
MEAKMSTPDRLNEDLLEAQEDTQEGKYLTFSMGKEEYGIEIRNVTEIIGIQNITDLPDMPNYVKGVINLRGKVIPVMDVRLRFGLVERAYDERTCIIVVNIRNAAVGLIVDSVSEVVDIAAEQIEPPPLVRAGQSSRYVSGLGHVENTVKILLSISDLLYEGEMENMVESSNQAAVVE